MPTEHEDQRQDVEVEEQDTSYLLSYTRHLERQARRLEKEKQVVESERLRLQRELNNIRGELNRLRTPPLFAGTLIEMIDDSRAVVKSSSGPQFIVNVSKKVDEEQLKPNARVALNQRTFAVVEVLDPPQDPSIKAMEVEIKPKETYADIGGLSKAIQQVREVVELPLLKPHLFEKIGITPPKGVLLHGPPGTGKTLLAKAVAHETNATFIRVIASELVQKFIGEGARLVREVFEFALRNSPSILFIDELDAIGSKRLEVATSGDREVQRTLMQLLSSMDGFENRGDVRVIGATNRPDILDPAILRPGRFDRLIEIPPADKEGREEIFRIHLRNMNLEESEFDMKTLIKLSDGFSGAEIRNICIEAGMFAIRDDRDSVLMDDFIRAFKKVKDERMVDDFGSLEGYE